MKTLADRARALLRDDILSGRLAPDSRLKLSELQARYGLGISPLREALMRLAVEGHVAEEGQKGFRVAPISPEDLADLTRARVAIERLALACAIEEGDADWEAGVLAAFHLLSRAPLPRDPREEQAAAAWEARHRAFHEALIAGCRSTWIRRMQAQLMEHSERYRRVRLFHSGPPKRLARDTAAEHRAILEAALDRDADQAARLIGEHLESTARIVAGYWNERKAKPKPKRA